MAAMAISFKINIVVYVFTLTYILKSIAWM